MSTESERDAKRKYNHSAKGRATRRRWRVENYERDRACNIKYEQSPKGVKKKRELSQLYKETGKTAEISKRYRENNPEKRKETLKRCYENMINDPERKEKARLNSIEWRVNNLDKSRAIARKYAKKHKEEIRVNSRKRNRDTKIAILTHYGGGKCACVRCSFGDIRALSIDHIRNDGYKQRQQIGNGMYFYRWLIKNNYPEGHQTLCMNCQFIKRAEVWQRESEQPLQ